MINHIAFVAVPNADVVPQPKWSKVLPINPSVTQAITKKVRINVLTTTMKSK